jgi:hypothetical protein
LACFSHKEFQNHTEKNGVQHGTGQAIPVHDIILGLVAEPSCPSQLSWAWAEVTADTETLFSLSMLFLSSSTQCPAAVTRSQPPLPPILWLSEIYSLLPLPER